MHSKGRLAHELTKAADLPEMAAKASPAPKSTTSCGAQTSIVLVDVDNTLSMAGWRDYALPKNGGSWKQYHSLCEQDQPMQLMIELVQALKLMGWIVVAFTGRPERNRAMTESWLRRYAVPFAELLMRPEGNFEKNADLKVKLAADYFQWQPPQRVILLDDHPDVVRRFSAMGYTALQVIGQRELQHDTAGR